MEEMMWWWYLHSNGDLHVGERYVKKLLDTENLGARLHELTYERCFFDQDQICTSDELNQAKDAIDCFLKLGSASKRVSFKIRIFDCLTIACFRVPKSNRLHMRTQIRKLINQDT